jgi:hypothetical protein
MVRGGPPMGRAGLNGEGGKGETMGGRDYWKRARLDRE